MEARMGRRWNDNFGTLLFERLRLWLITTWHWHVAIAKAVRQEPNLLFLFVVLPFTIVSLLILNSRATTNSEAIAKLREDLAFHIAQSRADRDVVSQDLSDRIADLERIILVDVKTAIEKKSKPVSSSPAEVWLKNRDAELRERLQALERWRLQQQQR
jgi:hypothetical protein